MSANTKTGQRQQLHAAVPSLTTSRVIGTLGVVLRSKTNHQIENARPLVEELIAAGMFLDDEFVDRVLASIGE